MAAYESANLAQSLAAQRAGLLPDGPQYYDAMRTTLQIDDDILKDARSIARSEGRSVGAVISDLARRSLRPVGIVVVDGLPMFDVPPDAPIIADEDVARGLEEDV